MGTRWGALGEWVFTSDSKLTVLMVENWYVGGLEEHQFGNLRLRSRYMMAGNKVWVAGLEEVI